MLKFILNCLFFCFGVGIVLGAEPQWFEQLSPGVTRTQILSVAGAPNSSSKNADIYLIGKGQLTLRYEDESLKSCIYSNHSESIEAWTTYSASSDKTGLSDFEKRKQFVAGNQFGSVPELGGAYIYTAKYGTCYLTEGKYLVVKPIIELLGGSGFFTNKSAQVMLISSDGNKTILYRASEYWKDLRPAYLSEEKAMQRQEIFDEQATKLVGRKLSDVFGKEDSCMGSGIDYRLFYAKSGLIVVVVQHPSSNPFDTIGGVSLWQPGL